MEFGPTKIKVTKATTLKETEDGTETVLPPDLETLIKLQQNYPEDMTINFYSVPPVGNIDIDEAEDMVYERIRGEC